MEESETKQVLDFLLSSYRAQMAIQNPREEDCPFDFQQFFTTWKAKYDGSFSKLREVMKKGVSYLVDEGIFDSIVPYLSASMNRSLHSAEGERESVQNKAIVNSDLLSLTPVNAKQGSRKLAELLPSPKHPKQGTSLPEDKVEITIHVCDEAKGSRQDFKCVQSLLLREMGYFSKLAVRGQKLKDMDISVHCDLGVFDWLMKWVKFKAEKEAGSFSSSSLLVPPILDAKNVIGLMVSAEFLQMPTLTQECVLYTAHNIQDVILHSPNLGCLSESLTHKIAGFFDNIELEEKIAKVDVNDRITSRLYTQHVLALNNDHDHEGDGSSSSQLPLGVGGNWTGAFASTKTMFKCHLCQRLLTNKVAARVPCTPASMRLDGRGKLYSMHVKEAGWSLPNFVREFKRDLKSWRKVYWRLWGMIHFLPCATCGLHFPLRDLTSCRFHPKAPQYEIRISLQTGEYLEREFPREPEGTGLSSSEEVLNPYRKFREERQKEEEELTNGQQYETLRTAFGLYPCCKKVPGYIFNPFPEVNGCAVRDHTILPTKQNEGVLRRLDMFRDLIVTSPPKLSPGGQGLSPTIKWGGVHELSPPKAFTSPTPLFPGLGRIQRPITLQPSQQPSSGQPETVASSSQPQISPSDSDDDEGEELIGLAQGWKGLPAAYPPYVTSSQGMSNNADFWNWNNDFTTRYNQDMQREREEKLMADLELLLAQKSNSLIVSSSSTSNPDLRFSSPLLRSRSRFKYLGGSFLEIELKWREEVRANKMSSTSAQNASSRASKSAKPS